MINSYELEKMGFTMSITVEPTVKKTFFQKKNNWDMITFTHCTEFAFVIRQKEESQIITDKECVLCSTDSKPEQLVFCYTHKKGLFDSMVTYRNDGRIIRKEIRIKAKQDIMIEQSQSDVMNTMAPLSRGGEGQPVFVDDSLFMGIEYPVAMNEKIGQKLVLHQYPFLTVKRGESYTFPAVVYGFAQGASIEESFTDYIYEYAPVRYEQGPSIFNEWAAHDELGSGPELTEELVHKQIDCLEELKKKTGFSFDYYNMDAFWFEENVPYTAFKQRTWPDGPDKILKRTAALGMKFGLWFDVNSDLVKLTDAKCNNRYQCEFKKCLADPDYLKLLEEGILHNVKKYKLHMLKLDFADFDCADPTHTYHAAGGAASKEPAVRGLIKVLENVRRAQPDMMVMAYNGFTTNLDWLAAVDTTRQGYAISPWWAFYLEYVYCGDPRPSEFPARSLRHSVDWYLDAMVEVFRESLLPFTAIDDCGIMVGKAETIYDLGKEDWRDGWMLSMSRGGKKVHFYGDLTLLEKEDYDFFRDSAPMFEKLRNHNKEYRTELIAGKATLGEPYGYSNSSGTEGYLTLVNPCGEERILTVSLKEWKHSGRHAIKDFYRNSEIADKDWDMIEDTFTIALQSEEVAVWEWKSEEIRKEFSGILHILPHSTSVLNLEGSKCSRIEVKFYLEDGRPNRSYAPLPKDFTIEGDVGKSDISQNIWSGLSWNAFSLQEGGQVKFCNGSGEEVKLVWQANSGNVRKQ